jgi:hypothetical protein
MSAITAEAIRTDRLTLLPLRAGHAGEMAAALADPDLHAFIGGAPLSPRDLRARYECLVAGSPDPAVAVIAHIHPDHQASAAVAAAAGLTPTDERHDGEVRWHLNL